MDENLIKEGDNVIFKRNDVCRSFQIRKNRQVYFEKNKFSVAELLDQAYGSTFEIDKGKLIKVETKKSPEFDANVRDPSTDNRDLQDLDSNQKMSKDDIMKMKQEGVTGEKIIEELIENSETFKTKTEFSQAKYLKKKKKKHIVAFSVLRPTPRLVLKIFTKEPQKICNLRADTLSQMLSYSNLMYGSRVAVVETCQGLVLSCILQRIGGQGKLIQLMPNSQVQPCRQVMDYFGFPKEEFRNVYTFPMSVLSDLKQNHSQSLQSLDITVNDFKDDEEKESSQAKRIALDKELAEPSSSTNNDSTTREDNGVSVDNDSPGNANDHNDNEEATVKDGDDDEAKEDTEASSELKPFVRRDIHRQKRAIRHKEAAQIILSKNLDCLIVACKYNPTPIVKNMMEFLPPSRPVVVFCPFLDPLVEIYNYIKEKHIGLQLKLSETWLREYQILPQRTHPMMNMSGNGGYLLTFTTCDPIPAFM